MNDTGNWIMNDELRLLFTKPDEYSLQRPEHYRKHDDRLDGFDAGVPAVSEWLMKGNLAKTDYPGGRSFAIMLSHDIDDVVPTYVHTALAVAASLGRGRLSDAGRHLCWRRSGLKASPYHNFRELMDLEQGYNAKSSFYFLTAIKDPMRFRYHIEDLKEEIREVSARGWDVGLHGGFYSFDNLSEICAEKDRLEDALGHEVIGFRNHYLREKVPDSWELLSRAGFKYDATYGYTDQVGFRNGMCHPFRPHNLKTDLDVDLCEIPLHLMDGAIFMNVHSFNQAWSITRSVIDLVAACHGVAGILFHNSLLAAPDKRNYSRLYERILSYGQERQAWMTSGAEIYRWWSGQGHAQI